MSVECGDDRPLGNVVRRRHRPGRRRGDLRLAATLALPDDVLAQFDVALDFPRRDELELIGTQGRISIPDPWICRFGYVELDRHGHTERLLADPTGKLHLAPGPDSTDAYRLEFAAASHAIESGDEPLFGRADAIAQAATVEAVREAARTGARVTPAR